MASAKWRLFPLGLNVLINVVGEKGNSELQQEIDIVANCSLIDIDMFKRKSQTMKYFLIDQNSCDTTDNSNVNLSSVKSGDICDFARDTKTINH